jgi:anti-sigma factor RsiW
MNCGHTEKNLVAYLDGKLANAERRQFEAHLAICAACQERAEGFRSVWGVLDELPTLAPSSAFDNHVRARVRQESRRAGFWSWIVPSPRMAFAGVTHAPAGAAIQNTEAEFGMINDLPVLEDYDVLTSFDALSELPVQPTAQPQPLKQM